MLAIGPAVVAAVDLRLKPTLLQWLRLMEPRELSASRFGSQDRIVAIFRRDC